MIIKTETVVTTKVELNETEKMTLGLFLRHFSIGDVIAKLKKENHPNPDDGVKFLSEFAQHMVSKH